jgi:hypothetical protein
MTSVSLNIGFYLTGLCKGRTGEPRLQNTIGLDGSATLSNSDTGAALIDQIIDEATEPVTIAAGADLDIDLTTGQTNPLLESISGADDFAKVRVLYVLHVSTSLASSIAVGNATSNSFQATLSAAGTDTLLPGEDFLKRALTTAGFTVDGTHKVLRIRNNDGVNAATVRYFIGGSKS